MDTATAFYPWYAYLGENLRNGHIPMWNPHQFAGTPFAADPESGWAYLPAMLLFTVFPMPQAAHAFLLVHVLIASLATYVLARSLDIRPIGAVLSGIAYSYSGFVLGAIGLLPRLEYNALSNLPGGYGAAGLASPTAGLTDWGIIEDWRTRLLTPGFHYVGVVSLALALAAPLLVRGRHAAPFFALTSVCVLVLARWQPTPLHVALSVLPGFGPMHVHAPERALLVWFIGPALLAGATVGRLEAFGRRGVAVAVLLTALVLVDVRVAWQTQLADAFEASGAYELHQVDLTAYFAPTGAARFLQSATAIGQARAIGYAQHVFGGPIPYTLGWANPKTVALGVNNRAVLTGVDDIQGYNPIHLARYDVFMRALNGETQNYHQTDVLEAGLGSPLLDLLGGRYIVMPAVRAADQAEPRLTRDLPTVYADADVKVLENERALPRAWIVHSAAQMNADEGVVQLAAGVIDPRRTALVEKPPPPLGDSPSGNDQARITDYGTDT